MSQLSDEFDTAAANKAKEEDNSIEYFEPRIVNNDPPKLDMPKSRRIYSPLEPVDTEALIKVASLKDDALNVATPIGGLLRLGTSHRDPDGYNDDDFDLLDDIVAVPKELDWAADFSQIPLMVDTQPPAEENPHQEYDFGRFPITADITAAAWNTAKATEMVLAVNAQMLLDPLTMVSPHHAMEHTLLGKEIYDNLMFVRRDWCEKDTRFAQILPGIIFYKKTRDGGFKIFTYQRGKGAGEERLAGGCSIVVGGHVNPHDFLSHQYKSVLNPKIGAAQSVHAGRVLVEGFWEGIINNITRECGEEVKIVDRSTSDYGVVDFAQYIRDEAASENVTLEKWLYTRATFFLDYTSSNTEKAHLAMFIGIDVPEQFDITTNEAELHDVGFVDAIDLADTENYGPDKSIPSQLESWGRSLVDSLAATVTFSVMNGGAYGYGSYYRQYETQQQVGHPVLADITKNIPHADRWKVGTIAQIFSPLMKFYNYNVFVHA